MLRNPSWAQRQSRIERVLMNRCVMIHFGLGNAVERFYQLVVRLWRRLRQCRCSAGQKARLRMHKRPVSTGDASSRLFASFESLLAYERLACAVTSVTRSQPSRSSLNRNFW